MSRRARTYLNTIVMDVLADTAPPGSDVEEFLSGAGLVTHRRARLLVSGYASPRLDEGDALLRHFCGVSLSEFCEKAGHLKRATAFQL